MSMPEDDSLVNQPNQADVSVWKDIVGRVESASPCVPSRSEFQSCQASVHSWLLDEAPNVLPPIGLVIPTNTPIKFAEQDQQELLNDPVFPVLKDGAFFAMNLFAVNKALVLHMLGPSHVLKSEQLEYPIYATGEMQGNLDVVSSLDTEQLSSGFEITDRRIQDNGFRVRATKDNACDVLFEITGIPAIRGAQGDFVPSDFTDLLREIGSFKRAGATGIPRTSKLTALVAIEAERIARERCRATRILEPVLFRGAKTASFDLVPRYDSKVLSESMKRIFSLVPECSGEDGPAAAVAPLTVCGIVVGCRIGL
ncbi:MAG: hypothetical protein SGCHY_000041 [Lobulomycetales sp.]